MELKSLHWGWGQELGGICDPLQGSCEPVSGRDGAFWEQSEDSVSPGTCYCRLAVEQLPVRCCRLGRDAPTQQLRKINIDCKRSAASDLYHSAVSELLLQSQGNYLMVSKVSENPLSHSFVSTALA